MPKQTPSSERLEHFSRFAATLGRFIYFFIALTLLLIGLGLIAYSQKDVWDSLFDGERPISAMLDAVALTVLALAVIDVSKYLLDEQVIRTGELRAPSEARAALTKFLTIITIAVSLEAIVLVFDANKRNQTEVVIYAAVLLFAVVAIVVGLGVYQWLSAKTEKMTGPGDGGVTR